MNNTNTVTGHFNLLTDKGAVKLFLGLLSLNSRPNYERMWYHTSCLVFAGVEPHDDEACKYQTDLFMH